MQSFKVSRQVYKFKDSHFWRSCRVFMATKWQRAIEILDWAKPKRAAESFLCQSKCTAAECRLLVWLVLSASYCVYIRTQVTRFLHYEVVPIWIRFFSSDRSYYLREWWATWRLWHKMAEVLLFHKSMYLSENCCYSGRWKTPIEGVRSGRIEAQLPRVWPRSSGVNPYLGDH